MVAATIGRRAAPRQLRNLPSADGKSAESPSALGPLVYAMFLRKAGVHVFAQCFKRSAKEESNPAAGAADLAHESLTQSAKSPGGAIFSRQWRAAASVTALADASGFHDAFTHFGAPEKTAMNTQVSFLNTANCLPGGRAEMKSAASSRLAKDKPLLCPFTRTENAPG